MSTDPKNRLESLQGQIERVTYTNEENGYTVAKIKTSGRRDLVTVIGRITSPLPGQILNRIFHGIRISNPGWNPVCSAPAC